MPSGVYQQWSIRALAAWLPLLKGFSTFWKMDIISPADSGEKPLWYQAASDTHKANRETENKCMDSLPMVLGSSYGFRSVITHLSFLQHIFCLASWGRARGSMYIVIYSFFQLRNHTHVEMNLSGSVPETEARGGTIPGLWGRMGTSLKLYELVFLGKSCWQ